jgi:hypothetical protein
MVQRNIPIENRPVCNMIWLLQCSIKRSIAAATGALGGSGFKGANRSLNGR